MKHRRPSALPRGTRTCPCCSVVIDRRFLMCLTHWQAVPVSLRRELRQALSEWRDDPGNGEKLLVLQRKQAEAIGLVN